MRVARPFKEIRTPDIIWPFNIYVIDMYENNSLEFIFLASSERKCVVVLKYIRDLGQMGIKIFYQHYKFKNGKLGAKINFFYIIKVNVKM